MSGRARPTRSRRADLSQHFLRAGRAARLIAATSIDVSDFVIEIGAGRGALTRPLARRTRRLLAVEVDPHLARKLRMDLGDAAEVHNGDFLKLALPRHTYKIVGNLPYAITTRVITRLVDASVPPDDAWLVVQREPAHRLCGLPYTNESLWSLRLKPHWHVEIIDRLARTDFDPPPSVDSVVLWMSKRDRPLLGNHEWRLYLRIIESAYRHGGTLRQATRPWLSKLQLRRLARDLRFGIDDRPSSLTFEQWLGLFRFVNQSTERGH